MLYCCYHTLPFSEHAEHAAAAMYWIHFVGLDPCSVLRLAFNVIVTLELTCDRFDLPPSQRPGDKN